MLNENVAAWQLQYRQSDLLNTTPPNQQLANEHDIIPSLCVLRSILEEYDFQPNISSRKVRQVKTRNKLPLVPPTFQGRFPLHRTILLHLPTHPLAHNCAWAYL